MRLYINDNEIESLKRALIGERQTPEDINKLGAIYERVVLCEKLQRNCRRASGQILNVNIETPFSDRE